MRRLAKNLILTTVVVNAIFFVDPASAGAASLHYEKTCTTEKFYTFDADEVSRQYLDFWSKFRDTVMPDPDEPQNNNPPKEMPKPKPEPKPKPAPPPNKVEPKPAN